MISWGKNVQREMYRRKKNQESVYWEKEILPSSSIFSIKRVVFTVFGVFFWDPCIKNMGLVLFWVIANTDNAEGKE